MVHKENRGGSKPKAPASLSFDHRHLFSSSYSHRGPVLLGWHRDQAGSASFANAAWNHNPGFRREQARLLGIAPLPTAKPDPALAPCALRSDCARAPGGAALRAPLFGRRASICPYSSECQWEIRHHKREIDPSGNKTGGLTGMPNNQATARQAQQAQPSPSRGFQMTAHPASCMKTHVSSRALSSSLPFFPIRSNTPLLGPSSANSSG